MIDDRDAWTYNDDALAPSSSPLSSYDADPVTMSVQRRAHGYLGVELDADAEIELEGRGRDLKGTSNVSFIEAVEEIVGGYGFLHDVLICGTLQEMLALSRGVLRADLVAVDALDRQALVLLFCSEFDECSMHIIERWSGEVRTRGVLGSLLWLWSGSLLHGRRVLTLRCLGGHGGSTIRNGLHGSGVSW